MQGTEHCGWDGQPAGIRLTVPIPILKTRNPSNEEGEGIGSVLRTVCMSPEQLQFPALVAEGAKHPWNRAASHEGSLSSAQASP